MSKKVTLRANQKRAIEVLLTSGNVTQAAGTAGVTRKTVHAWLKQPAFVEALEEAEAEALTELGRQLRRLDDDSIKALGIALKEKEKKDLALRASDVHLKHRARLRELVAGTKSEVTVGLDESTRQLLAPFFALLARYIPADRMEEFKADMKQIAGGEDA